MPDSIVRRRSPLGARLSETHRGLTAAAAVASAADTVSRPFYGNVGREHKLWMFYEALGEFGAFVDWVKNACTRVRLGAAELMPGADEPDMLSDGPAAQLVQDFYGGIAGQMEFWQAIIPQLLAPGEGWIVCEKFDPQLPLALADWSVQSTDTFRQRRSGFGLINEVQVEEGRWRELTVDSLPTRIWMPDPRKPFMARSPSQASLPIMRRIDLVDKRIMAELLSRIIMNGILWMPLEGQLPASPAYKDQKDPFWAEFLDIAAKNIGTPGSALAAVPFPVNYPGELIEKIKHMQLAQPFDEQLLVERRDELGRLAKSLPLSQERQEGMGSANHWTGWVIKEDDVKISIQPTCEIVFDGLTKGYLYPMLTAAGQPIVGPNGGKLIVWGDYSELTSPADKSAGTLAAYDRGEASGTALRRESGLDESDMPDPAEQAKMIWLKAARDGSNPANPTAIEKLTGVAPPAPVVPAAGSAPVGPASASPFDHGGGNADSLAPAAGPPSSSSPNDNPLPLAASAFIAPRPAAYANGHDRR